MLLLFVHKKIKILWLKANHKPTFNYDYFNKKDNCFISYLLNIYFLAVPLVSDLALCTVSNNSGNIFP